MKERQNPDWTPPFTLTKRFWGGCVLLLLAVSFLCGAALQVHKAQSLTHDFVLVDATITAGQIGGSAGQDDDNVTYEVNYSFTLNEQPYDDLRKVSETFYETHPVGTIWPIRVAPNDPELHELYDGELRAVAWGFVLISVLMGGIGVVFTLSGGNLNALRHRFTRR